MFTAYTLFCVQTGVIWAFWGTEFPKEARDPETWAVGRQLAADGDAMSRQLGEGLASNFPTHPDLLLRIP